MSYFTIGTLLLFIFTLIKIYLLSKQVERLQLELTIFKDISRIKEENIYERIDIYEQGIFDIMRRIDAQDKLRNVK